MKRNILLALCTLLLGTGMGLVVNWNALGGAGLLTPGAMSTAAVNGTVPLVPSTESGEGQDLSANGPLLEAGDAVLQALEDVAVRPTSQQTLVFLGKDFSLEHTAEEAQDLRFAGAGGSLLLKDASGRTLGAVTGIYLPTDETSVKPLDET